jgi:hypothetical protein
MPKLAHISPTRAAAQAPHHLRCQLPWQERLEATQLRSHMSLEQNAPVPRAVQQPESGEVMAIPQGGGLHHRYRRRAGACPSGILAHPSAWTALLLRPESNTAADEKSVVS